MLILVPILILVAIIVAIDQLYFNDQTPKNTSSSSEKHQKANDTNATQKYLDRYIKKIIYI
jgi:uncharacterized protein YpmS